MIDQGMALSWTFDPLEALRRWPADRPVVFLHSGRGHSRWSRWSILAEPTGAFRFRHGRDDCGQSSWLGDRSDCPTPVFAHKPFRDLPHLFDEPDCIWIGHLGYDLGRFIERIPSQAQVDRNWPLIQWHRCPGWLVHDAAHDRWSAHGVWGSDHVPALDAAEPMGGAFQADTPTSQISQSAFEQTIRRAIEYIAAGDVFQVNLAQRFTASFQGQPRTLFCELAGRWPAWYGAYVELLRDDPDEPRRIIISNSPELFLHVDTLGRVTTRPIKGTRPASVEPELLGHSEKDQAELNMIVDLLRNDLGRVCSYGTIRVAETRRIESHPTVHHGVATVTAQLHRGKTFTDLLRATLPGGSVTGAPKVRAMQIIEELEPVRRGPYCGAIGYTRAGAACLNIAIRTMLLELGPHATGRLDFSVGSGVVADSQPHDEYEETLDKATALMRALDRGRVPTHS